MKKINKKLFQDTGRRGGLKKGENYRQKRYEIIQALSGLVDKEYQNFLLKWPTEHLQRLLNAYKK